MKLDLSSAKDRRLLRQGHGSIVEEDESSPVILDTCQPLPALLSTLPLLTQSFADSEG